MKFRSVLAKLCLEQMTDVDEDAPLLEALDKEERELEEEMYLEMLEQMYGHCEPPDDFDISDEELDQLRREAGEIE